jgi:DNA invertase Pin-like site-specific DNA recombinase
MEQTTIIRNNSQSPILDIKIKYCLYARKSTEAEDRQALSIESQIKEMLALAEREGLDIVEIKRESHSSKEVGQRAIFNEMIREIREAKYNGILTWAPDRLSRNAGDLGSVVDLMDQKLLIEIRTYGQKFTNNPNEKFLLMILGSQAKLENDNKAVNVKRGLRTRCEMGWRPGTAPTGYLNEKHVDKKCQVRIDPRRAPVIKQMFEKVAHNHNSGRKLYHWLKVDIGFTTRTGKYLSLSNIYTILKNPYYYGMFEYPKTSNNWYEGKHIPLITKELFDQAQNQLTIENITRESNKEFAFTKIFKCGLCGSGITAEEKFKKLKDGTLNKYVYYGCTRSRDIHCKCGYIREEELIKQLLQLIDKLDINELGIKNQFDEEFNRYYKFSKNILGLDNIDFSKQKDIDICNYVKYLLKEGSILEKRKVLWSLENKLLIKNKKILFKKY